MVDDEAEESECDEIPDEDDNQDVEMKDEDDGDEADLEDDDDETSESSSESEEEVDTKPRKGRILKAFEDSDDESPEVESAPSKEVNSEISETLINEGASQKLEHHELIKDSQGNYKEALLSRQDGDYNSHYNYSLQKLIKLSFSCR